MTKKDLMENDIFKSLPDDTELVFNTALRLEDCRKITEEDITFRSEIVGWCQKGKDKYAKEPIMMRALVINQNVW